ncbi:MAG: GFA family protein [Erythrobacter sp.]|jgi:hypothetical protein|nr:GFA family protein [Erythrobacter sp.]
MNEGERLAQPITGQCLCGTVAITLTGAHREIDICHCTMCARWGGAMYAGLEADGHTVTGENAITTYHSSEWAERAFCSRCGSHLWYRFRPTGNRTFLSGLFDLPEGFGIKQQIFIDEKPDWYDLKQDSPKKTGEEVVAEAIAAGFTFD